MGFPSEGKSDSTLILGDQRWIATHSGKTSGNELRASCLAEPRVSAGLVPITVGFWMRCCGWPARAGAGVICRSGWATINLGNVVTIAGLRWAFSTTYWRVSPPEPVL